MLDFLKKQGIDESLIARIEQYRKDYPVAESDRVVFSVLFNAGDQRFVNALFF